MPFLPVVWFFGLFRFFRLGFQIVRNDRDGLLNRHSWSSLNRCNRFDWFGFCWKGKNHRCTFDQDGRQNLSFFSLDLLLLDWLWMVVSSLQNIQPLAELDIYLSSLNLFFGQMLNLLLDIHHLILDLVADLSDIWHRELRNCNSSQQYNHNVPHYV